MTYEEAVNTVRRPGKFEGQPPYVPYLWWWCNETGGWDFEEQRDEEPPVFGVIIRPEEAALFPQLRIGQRIYMWEDEQGFVYGTSGPIPLDHSSN